MESKNFAEWSIWPFQILTCFPIFALLGQNLTEASECYCFSLGQETQNKKTESAWIFECCFKGQRRNISLYGNLEVVLMLRVEFANFSYCSEPYQIFTTHSSQLKLTISIAILFQLANWFLQKNLLELLSAVKIVDRNNAGGFWKTHKITSLFQLFSVNILELLPLKWHCRLLLRRTN